jgi:hypothetical protein
MMTLQQAKYFLALCEEQSFTRAAKRCGVSQPSLTLAIKELEAELGGPLFNRGRSMSRLSSLGETVQPHLAAMVRAAADAKDDAATFLAVDRRPRLPVRSNPVLSLKPKENAMHKVVISTAVVAIVVLVAAIATQAWPPATASSAKKTGATVDIYKLKSTIDLKALPRQELNYVE